MKIRTENSEWAKIEAILRETGSSSTYKIEQKEFDTLSKTEQKISLKKAFERAMENAGVNLQTSFSCMMTGHDDKNPSMRYNKPRFAFHCFGCMTPGQNFDVFDAIAEIHTCRNYMDAYRIAIKLFVSEEVQEMTSKHKNLFQSSGPTAAMIRHTHNPYYYKIASDPIGLAYLEQRGISKKTAVDYLLMTWEIHGHWYLVFLNDNGSLTRRKFVEDTSITGMYSDIPAKWMNSKTDMGIFNMRTIQGAKQNGDIVFVTESAIDTLSLIELGYKSLALNGVNNIGLLDAIDYPFLLLMCDNDAAGLAVNEGMESKGFYAIRYSDFAHLGAHKDINAAFVANREATAHDIKALYAEAKKHYETGGVGNE